jgi:hypothetical protein
MITTQELLGDNKKNIDRTNAQRNRPYCALKIVRTQRVCPAVSKICVL